MPDSAFPLRRIRRRAPQPQGALPSTRSLEISAVDSRPVAFIDSGVGGLPYCGAFLALNPGESVFYVADRAHFPYGTRDSEDLRAILIDLVKGIREEVDPKLVVLACNTASVVALDALRSAFPDLPFVGTVPAVKSAASLSQSRRIGVVATEKTVTDPYLDTLIARFASDCEVHRMAAPELVEFVERRFPAATAGEREAVVAPYVQRLYEGGVDVIVLGCTHFLFLSDDFSRASDGRIKVVDSREGVARRAMALLHKDGTVAEGLGSARLAVTGSGASDPSWPFFAGLFGLQCDGSFSL